MRESNVYLLTELNDEHLIELMSLFACKKDLLSWGGPNFDYPFTLATFTEALNLTSGVSKVLVNAKGRFVAFGQCYERLNRRHLARLIVVPSFRGRGIVSILIEELIQCFECESASESNSSGSSLFVRSDNRAAINAYSKLGFTISAYPKKSMPFDGMLYMTKQG